MAEPDTRTEQEEQRSAPARILIVDDRPDQRLAYRAMLEDLGAPIVTAASGEEALRLALEGPFAVILLDVRMPGMSGFETASLLRQHRHTCRAPLLFVTSHADEVQSARGYELGAVDYILAPVVAMVLRTKVGVFLESYRAQAELAPTNRELEFRVRERTAELERSNAQLQQEIAERQSAQHEREALLARETLLRRHAEELSRLKDEFLATLSHELRTPLNAIFGWVTLLRTRRLDEPTQARALETIERNARAQKRLIEDLLDVSRIVSGRLTLEPVALDPRLLVEAAVATVQPSAQAKGVQLLVGLAPTNRTVRGDFGRLQQAVLNLLSNAIKFTPAGGTVRIELEAEPETFTLTVSDTGQGIKREFLPHVFDYFRQEDGSICRRHGGLGLGLTIVRHLVELHHGSVEAASEGEGQGARFVIRLPAGPPRGTEDPLSRE